MKWLVFALNRGFEGLSGITTTQTLNKCLSKGLSVVHIAWAETFKRVPWASKFHGLRIRRMRKVLKSVFSFSVFPFVRYKILLSFKYYTLFCFPSFIVFFWLVKAHTHATTIPAAAVALVKRHFFFCFPLCCIGKFLAICFWWWCFIVDRNELKYFLKRLLQSTSIAW